MNTLDNSIQILKEVRKWCRAYKSISEFGLIWLFVDSDEFRPNDSEYISLSDDMGNPLEIVHSSFLSLLLADVVKDKLKIFTWCSEINLVLSAIVLVIHYFWNFLINEDVSVNDVKHAL